MAKHNKTRSPRRRYRRVHYAVDRLPDELRAAVEQVIIGSKWPKDFKKHYNGTPRLCDIVSYCKTKGFNISKSAIGRFAQQTEKVSALKIINDFRSYARAHLGTLCLVYANIQSDLEISTIDSDRREVLEGQQKKNITRIEQLIVSLRKLDGNQLNPIHGG
jgi:hypothetical protein